MNKINKFMTNDKIIYEIRYAISSFIQFHDIFNDQS